MRRPGLHAAAFLSALLLAAAAAHATRGEKEYGHVWSPEGDGPLGDAARQAELGGQLLVAAAGVGAALALLYHLPSVRFAVAPLYTRISREESLDHATRNRIFDLIGAEPGIHASDVAARLGLPWGTAVYHLRVLERNGLVTVAVQGRHRRYYKAGDPRYPFREALAMLRQPVAGRIAALVAERPGITQREVRDTLGIRSQLASWHLKRLAQARIVEAERWGRTVRYAPGTAWAGLEDAAREDEARA